MGGMVTALFLMTALCAITILGSIPGWIARKARERRVMKLIRWKMPNVYRTR